MDLAPPQTREELLQAIRVLWRQLQGASETERRPIERQIRALTDRYRTQEPDHER